MSPPELSPVSNRTRKKSKAGCKTCKIRRVKCDETHPVCGNCKVYYSNRIESCEYDFGLKHKKSKSSSTEASSSTDSSVRDNHVLSLYLKEGFQQGRTLFPKTVGILTLDPFGMQPKSKLPKADQLLHFFLSDLIGKFLPARNAEEINPIVLAWWPLIQADTFLYHVTLQASALKLECLKRSPNAFHYETYSRESIGTLRQRFEDPRAGVSDHTIGAVATLAALAFGTKNMRTMKMHIGGLERMVAIRGGLERIKASSPATANVVFWFSLLMMQESIFPPEYNINDTHDLRLLLVNSESQQPEEHLDLMSLGIDIRMVNLMNEIRNLSRKFLQPVIKDSATDEIHSDVNLILQRLFYLKFTPDENGLFVWISEACRYASAIFLFLPFDCHFPNPALILNSLLHKLKSAVNNVVTFPGGDCYLMVWLLVIGGVISLTAERGWFIGYLVPVVTDLGLNWWEDMKQVLERIIWVQTINDLKFRQFWEEVQSAREYLAEQGDLSTMIYSAEQPLDDYANEGPSGAQAGQQIFGSRG